MKVVINACYGGFGLSAKAEDLYAEREGFELFRYKQTKYRFHDGEDEWQKSDVGEKSIVCMTFKKDHGVTFCTWPDDGTYWWSSDIERDDKTLVEVVEELGTEAASGLCSVLTIVDIPDDVSWGVEEYDGMEHVAEAHSTWC